MAPLIPSVFSTEAQGEKKEAVKKKSTLGTACMVTHHRRNDIVGGPVAIAGPVVCSPTPAKPLPP